jgi:streptomycin 6-kinase
MSQTEGKFCERPRPGCGTLSAASYCLRQPPEQRPRLGDLGHFRLGHFRRRRKVFERWRGWLAHRPGSLADESEADGAQARVPRLLAMARGR